MSAAPEKLTAIHVAIENHLIEMRDARLSTPNCGNGLVVREFDGKPSDVIRIGTREAIALILRESAKYDLSARLE